MHPPPAALLLKVVLQPPAGTCLPLSRVSVEPAEAAHAAGAVPARPPAMEAELCDYVTPGGGASAVGMQEGQVECVIGAALGGAPVGKGVSNQMVSRNPAIPQLEGGS